jgi:DNA repair protein RadA/Sms
MKVKNIFICQKCSHESSKWLGRCPDCQEWNSFSEETQLIAPKTNSLTASRHQHKPVQQVMSLGQHREVSQSRFPTKFPDLNTVLGGGVKIGSLILLSGEPGIGKSTLTLELCADAAAANQSILYISGEESAEQIAGRATRLGIGSDKVSLLSETCLENVIGQLDISKPQLLVIDSIQVIYSLEIGSLPGSISQIRYCTEKLMETCKSRNITCLIVGHVNKEGELAGPKVLEHLVDTVLFIEGERHQQLRLIRGLKNRFGSTNEIAIMEMTEKGLVEVSNPSEIFLQGRQKNALGSAITVTLEGSRPLLLEVQALSNTTIFGYPKRTANGFDLNRLQLIGAVLQKYLKLNLNTQDIFANVVGGFKLTEPAVDLSLAMAIISSYKKIPLPEKAVFLGEIGLSGELRPASHLEKRIREATKLGFDTIVTAPSTRNNSVSGGKSKIITVSNLEQAARLFFS